MPIANILGVPHTYELTEKLAEDLTNATQRSADGSPHGSSTEPPETLVFIHGWLLSQAYWQPLVSQLSDRYRCLTYDMRGFGASLPKSVDSEPEALRDIPLPKADDWHPGEDSDRYAASAYSLAAYAHDLGELLNTLGLDKVWLMGHSLGGSVALWAAYLLPERVKGVICLNAGGGIYIPKEFEKFRSAGKQMVKIRPAWLAKTPLLPRVFTRAMVHKRLDIRWGQQRIRDFVQADRAAAEGALLESTTCEEVHQLPRLVGQLSQPVHFITASQDSIMPPRYVRYLASFHRDFDEAEMVSEIDDCGHMAMLEQPEAVADVVRRVLGSGVQLSNFSDGELGLTAQRER